MLNKPLGNLLEAFVIFDGELTIFHFVLNFEFWLATTAARSSQKYERAEPSRPAASLKNGPLDCA